MLDHRSKKNPPPWACTSSARPRVSILERLLAIYRSGIHGDHPQKQKKAASWKQSTIANRQSQIRRGSYQPPFLTLALIGPYYITGFSAITLHEIRFFPKVHLWTLMDTKKLFKNILFC